MFSKKAVVLFVIVALLSIIAAQCGGAAPETIVETVVVTQEVEVVVTQEVEVVVTQEVEVEKEVVVTATPSPIPAEELPDMSGMEFKNPDTFVAATIGEPESLDPAWTYETSGGEIQMNIYEGVVAYNREQATEFVPALAEEWEVSDDGLVYTFHIREGVTFHEGGTLEPHDIAYSYIRGMLQDRVDGPQWLLLGSFAGVGTIKELVDQVGELNSEDPSTLDLATVDSEALVGTCERLQEAVAYDDDAGTVTLTLLSPAPWLPQLLAGWIGATYDQEWMAENGDWDGDCATWQNWNDPAAEESQLFNTANGTGPYKLVGWTPGDQIELEANEEYWRTEPMWEGGPSGPPSIKRVIFKKVDEWGTRLAMAQAGDADYVYVPRGFISQIDPMVKMAYEGADDSFPSSEINPNGAFVLHKGYVTPRQDISIFTFNINVEGGNPFIGSGLLDGNGIPPDFFSDIHIRKAFNYCFDWETYIRDATSGESIKSRGPVIPDMLGYDESSPVYEYDPDKCAEEFQAATLKSEDGRSVWETGFYLQIAYNTGNAQRQTMAEILKQGLEAVHPDGLFSVAVVNLPWPSFLDARRSSRLPIYVAGWQEDYHDASNWVQPYMDCQAGAYARAQFMPEDICTQWGDMMAEAIASTDAEARAPIYAQLQQEYYDNAPGIALDVQTGRNYKQQWVKGWYYNPLFPEPNSWVYALSKSQ
jgi:peptide/nickel transport system substrate-binding protein